MAFFTRSKAAAAAEEADETASAAGGSVLELKASEGYVVTSNMPTIDKIFTMEVLVDYLKLKEFVDYVDNMTSRHTTPGIHSSIINGEAFFRINDEGVRALMQDNGLATNLTLTHPENDSDQEDPEEVKVRRSERQTRLPAYLRSYLM